MWVLSIISMPFISSLPIRETDNGFEDKRFYVSLIREIEKSFKPLSNNFRNTFREDIDKSITQSDNFDEFLDKLKSLHYEIKMGKYIAARPSDSQNFIRFKSLGEFYSEQAIHNRFANKRIFESDLDKKIAEGVKILKESADTLSFAEKVLGGTYVQSLVSDERYRKVSDLIPNGFWQA